MVADIFGECKRYPHISTQSEITQDTTEVKPTPTVTHKVEIPVPKQPVKRKTKSEKPPAKRKRTEAEQTKPTKQSAKKKPTVKRSRKPAVYKAKFMVSPQTESSEEEEIYSNKEGQRHLMNELNDLATQGYFPRQSRGGFSYNPSYE